MLSIRDRLRNMKEMMQRNDERFQAMEVKRCRTDNPYYIVEICRGKPDMGNGHYRRYEDANTAYRYASWEWRNRARYGCFWDHVTVYRCVHDVSDAVCWMDGKAIGNGLEVQRR